MAAQVNIGLIGLGRMGQLYARLLARQITGGSLYAIMEPDERVRQTTAGTYNVNYHCATVEEMLALPELNAVVIATPTSTHAELVVAAAEAGKAIFCEKPLALTLDETRRVLEVVNRANISLQVGFMRRFDAAYKRAKDLIDAGQIGRPLIFKSVGRDPFCPQKKFANPALSGGLIIDMAIHDFDLARWLMGSQVTHVSAEGTLLVCKDLEEVGDIDNAVINLHFASGALGNVEVSRNAFYGYDIRTEVLGSEGALMIGKQQQTPVLLLTRNGAQHDTVPYLLERFGDAYRAQIQHFVDCLINGQLPSVGGAEALAALEIGIAATVSQKTKRVVEVKE
jgi:inositol 2-dehydrogenase